MEKTIGTIHLNVETNLDQVENQLIRIEERVTRIKDCIVGLDLSSSEDVTVLSCPLCLGVISVTSARIAHEHFKVEGHCAKCDAISEVTFPPTNKDSFDEEYKKISKRIEEGQKRMNEKKWRFLSK